MLILLLISCKANYDIRIQFRKTPLAPDYKQSESWAVLPNKWNSSLSQIVGKPNKKEVMYFIYIPHFSLIKKIKLEFDIYNPITRKDVIEKAVANQASAWVKAANLMCLYRRSLQDIC